MKQIAVFSLLMALVIGCSQNSNESTGSDPPIKKETNAAPASDDPMENKGVGPITSLELGPLDDAMAEEGKVLYEQLCMACHKVDEKFIGPAPAGILSRRSPEWIMNMILDPEGMVKNDPLAKALLIEFNGSPMANQNLTEDEARAILEYFRTL